MSILNTNDAFVLDVLSGAMQPVQHLVDVVKTLTAQLVETRKELDDAQKEFVALQTSFKFLDGVTPQYAHDCSPSCCTFLGQFVQIKEYESEEQDRYRKTSLYDLYYHSELDEETLIARYGDEEDDALYQYCVSISITDDPNDPLVEARRRARLLRLPVPN